MRRFSSLAFGISPTSKPSSQVYNQGSPRYENLTKIISKTAITLTHFADIPLKGKPSEAYDVVSRPPKPLALATNNQSSCTKNHKKPVNPIDHAHITDTLLNKNCYFLLNHGVVLKKDGLNPHFVVQVIQNQENPLLSLKFYIWVSNINTELASNQAIKSIISHVLYRKGPVVLSVELLREVREAGCRITEDLFCILIGSWGRLGLANYCTEVFSQMSFLGFMPSTRVYNSVIDALVKSNSLDLAYFKFQQMAADNCYPDRFTYNILIHGVCKKGIVDEALRLLKQMESAGYLPNLFTYTILIDGFCNAKRVEEAFQVLEVMRKRNVAPSEATFRTLIHGSFECAGPNVAHELLTKFIENEPVFHEQSCGTILYCLSKNSMAREASDFLRKMDRRGYIPDVATFNVVFACLVKTLDLNATCKVMDDFIARGGKPGFNTYLMLVNTLYREGRGEEGDRYVNWMFLDGLVCNVVSYNILMDCFCKTGMMEKASKHFREMVQKGVDPNLITFNTLISGYCKIKEVNKSRELLRMLLEHGFKPDVFTFSSIIDGLCRAHQMEDAFNCFNEMIEWGVAPNAVTYNILIRTLCAVGEIAKSMNLFKRMKAAGIYPDVFSFNSLILSLCKIKKMETAQNLLNYMMKLGATPDSYTYNAFIKGLCDSDRIDEAREILLMMEASDSTPNYRSYSSIIEAYSCRGRLEEAQALLRRSEKKGGRSGLCS